VTTAEARLTQRDTKAGDEGISPGVYAAVTCDWSWPKPDDTGYRVDQDNMSYWAKTFPYGGTQTPLSTAKEMASTLGFDLVTVTDHGTHGLSFRGNTCVDKVVTGYFRTGERPGNITCPTATGPGDAQSLTHAPTC
jgi:hypothetical protein